MTQTQHYCFLFQYRSARQLHQLLWSESGEYIILWVPERRPMCSPRLCWVISLFFYFLRFFFPFLYFPFSVLDKNQFWKVHFSKWSYRESNPEPSKAITVLIHRDGRSRIMNCITIKVFYISLCVCTPLYYAWARATRARIFDIYPIWIPSAYICWWPNIRWD